MHEVPTATTMDGGTTLAELEKVKRKERNSRKGGDQRAFYSGRIWSKPKICFQKRARWCWGFKSLLGHGVAS